MKNNMNFSDFFRDYHKDGIEHNLYVDMTEAIKNGNVAALEAIDWQEYCTNGIGIMSANALTQARYLVVVAVTMGSVFAISEGVNAELSLSLADYYIQEAEKITNIRRINDLTGNALKHFATIINRQIIQPEASVAGKAIEYIRNHIYQPLQVGEIADALGINETYLSRKMKLESGITVKDCIHIEKLREAESLMKYTEMSITEISVHLGYSDASHFTRICKKYRQCTPKALKSIINKAK